MPSYLVAFELNGPGRDETALVPALAALSSKAVECLGGVWLVASDLSADALRDALRPHLEPADRLVVSTLAGPAAWQGLNRMAAEELRAALRAPRT